MKSFKEEIKSDRFENEQQMLVLDIFFTADWLEQKLLKVLNKYKLTHAQFNMMMMLRLSFGKPLSVNEIKERILFKRTDVSRMIDRLVEKEYLIRELCTDNRRKVDVSISKKGVKLLKKITPEIHDEFEHFFEKKITKEEALNAVKTIDKMRT
ncbi:MAG: MarR family transcriptional regulator [Bacteroidetes bacterium]|nr:MAG: MarR family transcriptional regulator [Bacteroidota bacterium]RLD75112.1 MAG: MarR family transcriptional regulator [Bacteroidota bacterium]